MLTALTTSAINANGPSLTPIEQLGKELFFDTDLSTPPGMSCATCHDPAAGFTGPVNDVNTETAVYPGVIHKRFGNRKPPTAAYGGESPVLYYDADEGVWIGGMFWDGRATGEILGEPLADQAGGPFLNPVEQNNPSKWKVVNKVAKSDYADLFEQVWGLGSLDPTEFEANYDRIALSISAYEQSSEVNPYSSKYDHYLAGNIILTAQEELGLELFEGKAMCSACHPSEQGAAGEPPLFTDFTYDNLGVPRNPQNPFYFEPEWNPDGLLWVDEGLGGFLRSVGEAWESEMGKQKVPTLRNVDKRPGRGFVKAYSHNGYFKSLKGIVNFYNTRDVKPLCPDPFTSEKDALAQGCWPVPEVAANVNTDELGDLGLTPEEEDAIVAFMMTLSDGFMP